MKAPSNNSRRGLAVLALALGIAIFAVVLHAARNHDASAQEDATGAQVSGDTVTLPPASAALLQTAAVTAAEPQAPLLPGRLVWDEDRTARVLTPFAGRVAQILVKVGDTVSVGQPLVALLSPDFGAAQAEARKADAALQLAEHNWHRQQDLFEHGVSAGKDVEQAQADYLSAKAERERTQAQLKQVGEGREAVDQRFTLKSPIAGTVVERNLNPGQELRPDQAGAPLFVITDPDSLWVMLDATEASAPASLQRGATLTLHVQQLPGQSFTAQLEDVADFFDPQTRTVKLRGRFDNHQSHLKGGTYVTADLPAAPTQALQAPASTAFLLGADYYVFVVDGGGRYTRRKVSIEVSDSGNTLFHDGVRVGDQLVADGALFLERILEQNRDSAQAGSTPSADKPG